jgi:hypothetical protein
MTTPDAAAVIAAHYRKEAGRDCVDGEWVWLARCDCGWVGTNEEYPVHVADMLAEAGIGPVAQARAEALRELTASLRRMVS